MARLSVPCPHCVSELTHVISATWDTHFKTVRRWRLCLNCAYKWATIEVDHDQALRMSDIARKASEEPQERGSY